MERTVSKLIENIKGFLSELDVLGSEIQKQTEDAAVISALNIKALVQDRIQREGKDKDGKLLGGGQYSTTPATFDKDDFVRDSFFNAASNGNSTVFVEGGYKELRELNRLQTDIVDLSFSYPDAASMWNNIDIVFRKVNKFKYEILVAATNADIEKRLTKLGFLYNTNIVEPSDSERALVIQAVNNIFNRLVDRWNLDLEPIL